MAVEVIFTIASRGLRISGSGTFSTRISCLPYQQVALITFYLSRKWFSFGIPGLSPDKVIVFPGSTFRSSSRLPFCPGNLTGFHELLEPVQLDVNLLFRIF